MEIVYTIQAKADLQFWKKSGNIQVQNKISRMLEEIVKNPHSLLGIGKPEKLKHNYSGCISRRITVEHRLIYKVEREEIIILALRFHY
jgi:toxin YoeB